MKKLLLTLCFILSIVSLKSQIFYEKNWQKVDSLDRQRQPKSAMAIVTTISLQASAEGNELQSVKCLLYGSKFLLETEENAHVKVIKNIESHIKKSDFPVKNILNHHLGKMLWDYVNRRTWQIYERTYTNNEASLEDFEEWDIKTFEKEINKYYSRALLNPEGLQNKALKGYVPILNGHAKNKYLLESSLYELIQSNALEFYRSGGLNVTQPVQEFTASSPKYFLDTESFLKLNLPKTLNFSHELETLKAYQALLSYHKKEKNTRRFFTLDLERLEYINDKYTNGDKNKLFQKALLTNITSYKNLPLHAIYVLRLAEIMAQEAKPENETLKWKKKSAIALLENYSKNHPNSEDINNEIRKKINEFKLPYLAVTGESYLIPNQPNKVLLKYKNLNEVIVRVINLSREEELKVRELKRAYRTDERAYLKELTAQKAVVSEEIKLRNEGDFLRHTTEIPVPQLTSGIYCIGVSFKDSKEFFMSYQIVHVTNVAVTSINNYTDFYLSHRKTGAPLNNCNVDASYVIHHHYNDYRSKRSTHKTKKDGKFSLSGSKNIRDIVFKVKKGKEVSYHDIGSSYISTYEESSRDGYKSFIFTDRGIYRPGQTVYFKSILTSQKRNNTAVVADKKATITLYNVNGEKVQELQRSTNEYGALSGAFIIPKNGLNGNYNIQLSVKGINKNSAYKRIKVEEYKRPKFFVEMLPVTGNYKLNDSIKVSGKAESYAGSQLSEAKVKYTITRTERYYYPWYEYWRSYYSSYDEGLVVANGATTLEKDGTFKIDFFSQVEEGKEKVENLIYSYSVNVDVIDINGETHSSSTSVQVGNISLSLSVNAPASIFKKEKEATFSVYSANLNEQFLPTQVELKVYKLKAPEKTYRKRELAIPDYKFWTKKEYQNLFPYEAYEDYNNLKNWQKEKEVFSTSFNTEDMRSLQMTPNDQWVEGNYVVIVTGKDKSGIEIENASFFKYIDNESVMPLDNNLFQVDLIKRTYKKGEKGSISLKTAAEKLNVLVQVEKYGEIISEEWINLKKGSKSIGFKVDNKDEGQFAIHYSFIYENTPYSYTSRIYVEEPSRALSIETLTFRDKIRPGEKETWKFKISGPNKEKITAEFLASMYDKSLDKFQSNSHSMNTYTGIYTPILFGHSHSSFGVRRFDLSLPNRDRDSYSRWRQEFLFSRSLNFDYFGVDLGSYRANRRMYKSMRGGFEDDFVMESSLEEESSMDMDSEQMDSKRSANTSSLNKTSSSPTTAEEPKDRAPTLEDEVEKPVGVRKNLQETAFFYPHLETDKTGNLIFSFDSPEAMTTWKLQLLGHTKDARCVTYELETKTQKELFVTPNAPRFLREGDEIILKSKITNLSEKELSGTATLILFNAITNEEISAALIRDKKNKPFTIDALGNTGTEWTLSIPDGLQGVRYQVQARAGDFTDGEENFLPVLTNRKLVTETMPLWVRGNEVKAFTLEKLKNNSSGTLKHHKLTLEMTSNPSWYAVQALPYLMEYPYECAEQTFARYYANVLGNHILNSNPKIKLVFDQWKNSAELMSNLEKNQELKSILIEETPWLRDAESETEQQKRIALLFDLHTITTNLKSALKKLNKKQNRNGSWSWFEGGNPSRSITQHIMQGFGHLKSLGVKIPENAPQKKQEALNYLENEFATSYEWTKNRSTCLECNHLSSTQLQYMYLTTLWKVKPSKKSQEATDYYLSQIKTHWTKLSLYNQGLSTLISSYYDKKQTTKNLLASIKQRAVLHPELGAYWKENTNSWNWYESDVETQALLIEVFAKLTQDTGFIDEMKIWLLKNKQTNRWKTTKATTEAVYALLLKGTNWLEDETPVQVKMGENLLIPNEKQAGTGYFKETWPGTEVTKSLATVKVINSKPSIAWGGVYWQYFEDLDKITSAKTPLNIEKKLFLKQDTNQGQKLIGITNSTKLEVGDLVKVRIVLKSDRDMEFIHMKDMRSSGLEPINVISRYKWKDGLGYYHETKDVSTNFFFDYLPKGTYVFEYDLRANNEGDFSNGITTIQSMYAPEFSSHSAGVRLRIK